MLQWNTIKLDDTCCDGAAIGLLPLWHQGQHVMSDAGRTLFVNAGMTAGVAVLGCQCEHKSYLSER